MRGTPAPKPWQARQVNRKELEGRPHPHPTTGRTRVRAELTRIAAVRDAATSFQAHYYRNTARSPKLLKPQIRATQYCSRSHHTPPGFSTARRFFPTLESQIPNPSKAALHHEGPRDTKPHHATRFQHRKARRFSPLKVPKGGTYQHCTRRTDIYR